jgi:hypothetical protein
LLHGQLGVGEKVPCSFEPIVIKSLAGIGIRCVATSPESTTAYAVSGIGAVYSWGGGGSGPVGIDFDFHPHITTEGNTWFTKPGRVDKAK